MPRPMDVPNFFLDEEQHLRSGWRLAIFAIAFLICAQLSQVIFSLGLATLLRTSVTDMGQSNWAFVAGHGSILFSGLVVGWGCGALLEELPFRSLGASTHRGWLKNLGLGSVLGVMTLVVAALLTFVTRGVHFQLDPAGARPIGQTVGVTLFIFVFAAAAEEILFRGYPLQTLTRANLAWLGVLLTSVPFAAVHLNNPHAVPGFTFVNTALAGVWLAVAYLRTRSLWLPLALHWSWNWAQASVLGFPVSGIERIAPAPLLQAINLGPDWVTGGAYGIEGGAACTVALILSTLFIWRTKLFACADVVSLSKL